MPARDVMTGSHSARASAGIAAWRPAAPEWCVGVDGFDPHRERVHESLTLADGRLGTRGSPLVGDGATTPGVFWSGCYEGEGSRSELARLPTWSRLAGADELRPQRRTLDLQAGVLYEEGPLTSLRFSSLARPGTVAMRVHADPALLPAGGATTVRGPVSAEFRDRCDGDVFERIGAYDPDPGVAEAAATAQQAGFDQLLREHREAWARRWQEADVVVEGDPDLQRATRFALFHLMASVGEQGEAAVGARGLSGPAYRGHVFWDSDVFVLPFLAATWTQDAIFAAGTGRDLLVETARYWASRIRRDGDGRAPIDEVEGPDEYHEPVDDNAYTNVMARWNLRRAAALDGVADDERAGWLTGADALVDGYDPSSGIYKQFAGFLGLEPTVIAEISRRPVAADLLFGLERTAQTQVIKQADTLMLHHLVPDDLVPGSLAANLDFYEPRTAHGSSLSPAVHVALLARTGRFQAALEWLRVAARIDLDDLTASTAGGLHLATMGGLWQALAFGFAGVRATPQRLLVDPHLPPQWRALELGLRYRGEPFRLRVEPQTVEIDSDALALQRVGDRWEVTPT